MVRRALKAARRSDVCLLVIDATDGLSEQEARLSTFANEAGRACVVVVNKWDLVANKDDRLYRSSRAYVESKLSDVAWAQCIYVSAKTGLKTQELFKAIDAAAEQHKRRVGSAVELRKPAKPRWRAWASQTSSWQRPQRRAARVARTRWRPRRRRWRHPLSASWMRR